MHSRVRSFTGIEGDIIEVRTAPDFVIKPQSDRVPEGAVTYSVLWEDGTVSDVDHAQVMPWH